MSQLSHVSNINEFSKLPRINLKFGGGDVTMCFFWLLQKCSFPYKECDPLRNNQDAVLLVCKLDLLF